ncbi:unnamed protein product [Fraxinus pennsylvanica]|uniref:Uncharacterized protein n=1 Tax=Fraxinus pennsylvanica TaxID=56036 RepID=A0AAD2DPT0_9LAMI|nr:unnamed protein product [Fraxinus pennsylvanica]
MIHDWICSNLQVQEHNHPHILLLQIGNTFCKLPGGRLKPGENEIEGLKRKLSSKLAANSSSLQPDWQSVFFPSKRRCCSPSTTEISTASPPCLPEEKCVARRRSHCVNNWFFLAIRHGFSHISRCPQKCVARRCGVV